MPRGVGNAYQALEDGTAYSYLVNDHWRPGTYPALSLGDPTAAIPWPIPSTGRRLREGPRQRSSPTCPPLPPKKTLIIGSKGQLGRALQRDFPIRRPGGPGGPGRQRPRRAVAAWPGTSTQSC